MVKNLLKKWFEQILQDFPSDLALINYLTKLLMIW